MTCRQAIKRPMALRSAGLVGASAPRKSWDGARVYLTASWTVLNIGLVAHAVLSEGRGEIVSECAFGLAATVSTVVEVWWAVRNYFTSRPSVDGQSCEPSEAERKRWREIAARMAFLKAEIAKRQRHHKSVRSLLAEMRELRTLILIGRV